MPTSPPAVRRRPAAIGIAVAAVLVLTACSATGTPKATPSAVAGSATPNGAGPTAVSSAEFDQLVAAAKAEGKLTLSGPRGLDAFQKVIADGFTAKYGIKVDYSGKGSSAVLKKMEATKSSDPYPFDILVGGYDTLFANLAPEGALADLDSQIVLAEDVDGSKWAGGHIPWDDAGHTSIGFLSQAGQYFYIDTDKASLSDITSYRNLLDPKWKGQILVSSDPRTDGTGNAVMALFSQSKGLGDDFVTKFLTTQDLKIAQTDQEVDADIKNPTFLMCVCNNSQGVELMKQHPNFQKLDPHKVAEGTSTTSSFANLAMPSRVAHPNAAKLYVNWILSQEAGTAAVQASGLPSVRTDVARDNVPAQSIPDPSWPPGSNESALDAKDQAQLLALEVMGPMPPAPSSSS